MLVFLSSLFRRLCVLAVFSVSAVLHGASPGFPFVEDFQAEIFIDGSRTTARWTSDGVTLKHAGNLHKNHFSMQEKSAGASGTAAIEDIALQDINGDGHLDLVAAGAGGIAVYFMDPSSEALFVSSTVVTTVPRSSVTFGDYDEDGDLDIVAGSAEGNVTVMLYENPGGGAFAAGISLEPMLETVLLVNALATADIDGDNHLDVVLAINEESGDLEFYEGKGDGNFQFHEPIASGMAHRDLKVGDMDGDGHVDIVVGDVYHRNLMEWGFEEADLTIPGGSLALGDINNDGHLDIVRGVNRGRNRLHLNDGRGGFSTGTDIGVVRTTSDIAVGDLDGDGDLDLVEGVLSERRRRAFVHSNPGVEVSRWPVSNLFTADTRAVALGDVDGDGDLDIALGHRDDALKVKINPGGSTATAPGANLFDTVPGWVVSSPIITGTVPSRAHLKAVEEKPVNTEIVYYLSNDGGNRWRQVKSPGRVDFAGKGKDLRWGARLTSLSPTTSPRIVQVDVEAGLQVYVDSTPHKSGQVWLAPDVEVGKPPFQASLLLKNRGKDALDIVGMELGSDMEGFSLPEHRPTASSPHTIASEGELGNLWIRFSPSNRETHSTVLTISSRENGNDLPDFTLTLEGDGEAPVIDIGRITVPPTRTGREGNFTIGLRNTGERFLVVTATRTSDVTPPSAAAQSTAERPLFGPASPWQTTTFSESGLFQRFPFVFRPHHRGLSSATLTFSSNAFNEDENEVMLSGRGLAPVIAVDVDGAFGEVDVNTETTRAAVIRNTGDWPLMVTNIRFAATPAGGFGFSPEETSFPVSQTETRELVLSFQPGEAGEVMNELLVISDAHNARSADRAFVIELSGEGVAPHIGVMVDGAPVGEQRIYSFGKQRLNTSKSVSVSIDNTAGTALLRVDPVARSGGEHLPFAWTGSSAIDVVRGGSATSVLTVLFEPTERGFHNTTLAITSNALNSTRYELTLTGTGTAPLMEVLLGDARQPSGSTWSFGWVSPGTVATQAMTIHNAGDDTLQIKAHPSFGNDAFTAGDPGGYRYPNSVGAQSSASYVLTFEPPPLSPAVEMMTTMTITSDDFPHSTYTLGLSGMVDLQPVFEGPLVTTQNYEVGVAILPLTLPEAASGNTPITYTLTPQTLPPGLLFDAGTRVLSGTPTTDAVATTWTWKATDANGDTAILDFTITVRSGICSRTQQVRDEIVGLTAGVTSCADITATHLGGIEWLDLRRRNISVLKRGDFAGLGNLSNLDLSSNHLSNLDKSLFAGLGNLRSLNLSSNRLSNLDKDLFSGLGNLRELLLGGNRLSSLDKGLFAGLDNLRSLSLSSNLLSGLDKSLFAGLGSLDTLDLSFNHLRELDGGLFAGLDNLNHLVLSFNRLDSLDKGLFAGLRNLRGLHLLSNRLGDLDKDLFSGLSNLNNLALSINRLSGLDGGLFSGLGNLRRLHLHNNRLSGLPEGLFDGLNLAENLRLDGNPGSPFVLDVYPEFSDGVVRVRIDEGAPREIRVNWTASDGLNSTGVAIIAAGTQIGAIVTATAGRRGITVALGNPELEPATDSSGDNGFRLSVFATENSLRISGTDPIAEVVLGDTPQPQSNTHSFGRLSPGTVATQAMTVRNFGDVTLQIKEEPSLGGAFRISNPNGYQYPHSVEAMSSASYVVSFEPPLSSVSESLTATMTVINNDPLQTTYTVVLHGEVVDLQPVFEGPPVASKTYEALGEPIAPLTLPEATSGNGMLIYELTPTTLPSGLSFDEETRVLSGTLSAAASATTYTWTVTDADGDTAALAFTITAWAGVCNRTRQVRDKIVDLTAGTTSCAGITATHLAGISELWLNESGISTLKRGDFAGLGSLEGLYLHDNRLTDLDEFLFSGLSSLRKLYLQRNHLSGLDKTLFSGLSSLEILDLKENRLSRVDKALFSGLSNLERLHLGWNRLSAVDKTLFSGLSSLEWLSLGFNQLSEVDKLLFSGLNNLQSLHLDNNRLSEVDKTLLSGSISLEELFLHGNRLSELPEGLFDGLNLTYQLLLDRNPGSPFVLDVYPELSGDGVRVRIDEGAPREIRVNWAASGGSNETGVAIIAGGARSSTNMVVTAGRQAITVALTNPRFKDTGLIYGLQLAVPATMSSIRIPGTDPIAAVVLGDTSQPLGSTHSFGQLSPGDVVTQAMTIHNLGDVTLQIKQEPSLGGAFRISNPNGYQYPHSIETMSSASYVVSFEPPLSSVSGDLTATMTIINNDPLQSTYTVVLHGEVIDLHPVFEGPPVASQIYEVFGEPITPLTLPEATSGDGTLTYKLTPATLPPGLSFNEQTRVLSGTPTEVASATTWTWTATDADGDTAALDFTITVQAGICNRTREVRDAIVEWVAGVTSCADITATHLGEVEVLYLDNQDIATLKRGDFAGLTNLTELDLSSNLLESLNAELFAGLSNLMDLNLRSNRLASLDAKLFSGLSGLERLNLRSNRLASLNAKLFTGLGSLERLDLYANRLSELPHGIFDGLDVERLYLNRNPASPFVLNVYPALSGSGARARIDEGAPREIQVTWTAVGGFNSAGIATIPAGSRYSPVFGAMGQQATTITLTNPVFSSTRYLNGLQLAVSATAGNARIPSAPVMEVMLGDAAQPSGSTHSFGWLSPGTIATQAMTIHNLGETTLQIKTSPTASGAFRVGNPGGYEYPRAVEAMSSASYVVSFEPPLSSVSGDLTAAMTIISNDPLQSTYTAVLHGEVIDLQPVFEVPPMAAQNYEVGVRIIPLTLPEATSGDGTLTYELTPQTRPPGLSVDAGTRALSGTPTVAASAATYTWKATDADGDTATLNFIITVRSGICNRTRQVRDEIVRLTPGVTNCADITAAHLNGIDDLDLYRRGISTLKTGDFAGLTNLTRLVLVRNNLTSLQPGIFAGLTNLNHLALNDIGLSSIDNSLFTDLTSLTRLALAFNNLTSLKPDTFAGLSKLAHLRLINNQLSELPAGIFDGLNITYALLLEGNPGSPFMPDIYPELLDAGVRARIDEGAPREIQVTWTATGGSNETGVATIPAGSRFSPVFATADRQRAVTIALTNPRFSDAERINGIQLAVPAAKRSVRISGTDPIAEVVLGDTPQPLGSTHSFGRLSPGAVVTQAVTIHNIGDVVLQIMEEPNLGGAFRISNPNGYRYPHSVEALSSASYVVSFEPPLSSVSGDLTATMTVINNDPLQTTYTVALHGEVVDLQPVFEDSLATIQNYEVGVSNPLTLPEATSGDTPIIHTLTPQTLPPGLLFDAGTLVLSGTPTTDVAPAAYTWKATDADGDTVTLDFTITVRSGICNRTRQVRDKIVGLIAGVTNCADITATHLGGIERLDFRWHGISALKRGDFAGLSSLEWLHLGFNRLSGLDKTLFAGLGNLEELYLHDNHLAGLDKTLFSGLSSLEWLHLGQNQLSKVDKSLFSGLSSLERLDLNDNSLTEVDKTLFFGLNNLEWLSLGHNQLSEVDETLLTGLSNLEQLYLDNNNFSELDEALFSGLSNLRVLHLHGNQLFQLPEGLFDGLNLTNRLWLHENSGSPFVLDVYPELSGSGARVRIDEGAPREIRVNWTASGGSSETGVVTIPAGARVSNRIGTAGRQAITVALTNPGFRHTGGIYGLQLAVSATRSSIRIPGTDPIAAVVLGDTPQPLGSTHSFGQLSPGNVATQAMTIHNIGDVTLQIRQEPSLAGAFRISNPNGYRHPHLVEAMSSASYVVSFEPPLSSVSESLMTTMTINNNDPLQSTYTVVLHGEVVDLQPVFEGPPVAAQNHEVGVQIAPLTLPEATNGNMPITYTLTPQTLPPGLSFATATRVLSGTPTATASAAAHTLTATDADGDTATLNFTITVRSGICNRTRKVREEIVELTPGVTNCAGITAAHLSGINLLDIGWHGINTLKTGDFAGLTNLNHLALNGNRLTGINSNLFAGLTNLTRLALAFNRLTSLRPDTFAGLSKLVHLRLANNQLSALPPGIFDGLNLTTSLLLGGNPGAPFTLNIYPELSANGVRARIDEGAPREIQVSWAATGGSNETGATTIPAGSRFSPVFATAVRQAATITLTNPGFRFAGNITGVRLAVPATGRSARIPGTDPIAAVVLGDTPQPLGSTHSFGQLAPGSVVTQAMTVRNLGDATLQIKQEPSLGGAFRIGNPNGYRYPHSVEAMSSASYVVLFEPLSSAFGDLTATMTIINNDPLQTTYTVVLHGEAIDLHPVFEGSSPAAQNYEVGVQIPPLTLPEATSGNRALTYTLTPALPPGLSFNAATRALSGTPTAAASAAAHTLTATDADGDTATLNFTITVRSGICNRTERVRDKIMRLIPGVTNCADITAAHLSGINQLELSWHPFGPPKTGDFAGLTNLDYLGLKRIGLTSINSNLFAGLTNLTRLALAFNRLTSLRPDTFAGLSKLVHLRLANNQLSALPPGIFDGLNLTTSLFLEGNPGAPFTLNIYPELSGNGIRARIDEGAPRQIQVSWTATGGSNGTGAATIPAGSRFSTVFVTAGQQAITITLSNPRFSNAGNLRGVQLAVPATTNSATLPALPPAPQSSSPLKMSDPSRFLSPPPPPAAPPLKMSGG